MTDDSAPVTSRTRRGFTLAEARTVLARTPAVLDALLRDLPADWVSAHEGGDSWSPFDVVGHLIHADRTNWLPRARTLLQHGETRAFDGFDRLGQFELTAGRTHASLLDEFAATRAEALRTLEGLALTDVDLDRRGRHPDLGTVTLRQLLSTWVVHDLDHLMQVSRVLARQYTDAVGPWRAYLRIVRDEPA